MTLIYTPRMPRPGSQSDRILRALADGRWHTVNYIHRHAGPSRLNSRVSDLRRLGWAIVCERVPHERRGSLAYRYRCLNPPTVLPSAGTAAPETPRDTENRHRVYTIDQAGERKLIGTAPDPESVGVLLYQLGTERELEGECVGWLDTYADPNRKGTWILNPWDQQVTT